MVAVRYELRSLPSIGVNSSSSAVMHLKLSGQGDNGAARQACVNGAALSEHEDDAGPASRGGGQ